MKINRFGNNVSVAELRLAAKFLRGDLPQGADVIQLAKVAKWLEKSASDRADRNKKLREDYAEKAKVKVDPDELGDADSR